MHILLVGDLMRKYYQYFGLALIMIFSFYYTEKIALIVLNKNPLMQSIEEQKESDPVCGKGIPAGI